MANEQIIVEYKAQVEGFRAELRSAIESIKSVDKQAKESASNTGKHFQSASSSIKDAANSIALELGLAFGTAQVIEFGKQSVKAFLEAEVNANKLRFSVTKIGGEGEAAFRRLIEQSSKLQDISIFSDDDIQNAQTQLATLGLNSKQIEELIPKVLDLASATGQDLSSATQTVIQGINGQTRGLKAVGLEFDATSDKTKNLSILTEGLTKFQGATADALQTTTGKAQRFQNAIDDIKESVGQFIVTQGTDLLDFIDSLNEGFDAVALRRAKGVLTEDLAKQNDAILLEASKSEEKRQQLISESEKKITDIQKKGLLEQDSNRKSFLLLQLQNEQKLISELRSLNQEKNNLGVDQDAIDKAKKLREDAAKDLLDFDKKVNDELLESKAQTEVQKLELARDNAFAELEIKAETARAAGVSEKLIAESTNKDIIAIQEKFNNELTALNVKAYNERAEKENAAIDANEKKLNDDRLKALKLYQDEVDKIKAEGREKEKTEDEKRQKEKEKEQEAAVEFLSNSINAISELQSRRFSAEIEGINEVRDQQLESLQQQLDNRIITEDQYEQKRKAIEERARNEERKVKQQQFEAEKQAAIIQAIINTAVQATKVAANPVLLALALATGAAQIALIESQPTPKFAKGVVDLKGAGTGTSDSIHAMLSRGESVVTAEATSMHKGLLEAMNKNKADKYIQDFYIAPILRAQLKKHNELKDSSFASNIANSLALNSSFKDGNLLESLKQSRRSERENFNQLIKVISNQKQNKRNW